MQKFKIKIMKKLENEKKLEELYKSFDAKDDSLFAIGICGNEKPIICLSGNLDKITDMFYQILSDGLSDDATDEQLVTVSLIMDAIHRLIMERSESTEMFDKFVVDAFEESDFHSNDDDTFVPTDRGCLECEQYVECLKKHFAKFGVEIEVKKKPVGNGK